MDRGSKLRFVAAAFGIATLGLVGFALLRKETPAPARTSEVITFSTDEPDEQKPSADTFVWKGRASDPKYISLPTVNAEGFIQNVGVDQNNAVAVPNNIHMAGWFAESSRPGQAGLSIIDGHVDGRRSDGIFKNLNKLKENDELTVELGGGKVKRFRVKKVTTIDTTRSAEALFSHEPTLSSQLNLITCDGNFDRQTKQYNKRVIVVTELIT